jgi:hypothetical protein
MAESAGRLLFYVTALARLARSEARPRETVTAFLRRTGWATRNRKYGWQFRKGLPTILEINGEAVLRRDWRCRRIGMRAEVRFVSCPSRGRRRREWVQAGRRPRRADCHLVLRILCRSNCSGRRPRRVWKPGEQFTIRLATGHDRSPLDSIGGSAAEFWTSRSKTA